VEHAGQPPVTPELFELLASLRSRGVIWVVNTGRALEHIVEGLKEFEFPLDPDFVATTERHLFRPATEGPGWDDYGDWNLRCEQAHQELFTTARPLLNEVAAYVQKQTRAKMIFEDGFPAGLISSTDEEMDRIIDFIEKARDTIYPALHYQRNTLYLRFCHMDYSKGAALGELGRLLGISRNEIFAAGDHYNDLAMLDGRYAKWVACPSNSTESVKATVRGAGGYVARGKCSEGIVEALRFFENDGEI